MPQNSNTQTEVGHGPHAANFKATVEREVSWPSVPGVGQLHLWTADMDRFDGEIRLPQAELDEASRFRFERDQRRYRATRMITRLVLSKYMDVETGDLLFKRSPGGKPYLEAPEGGYASLQFNISHSGKTYLLGVMHGSEVGVDIEQLRPIEDAAELVRRFFHPSEADYFEELAEDQRQEAFYLAWTRKESVLKCTGKGLSAHLDSLIVTLDPRASCELLAIDPRWGHATDWTLLAPPVSEHLACAVASRTKIRQTTIFELSGSKPSTRTYTTEISPPGSQPSQH